MTTEQTASDHETESQAMQNTNKWTLSKRLLQHFTFLVLVGKN